MVFWYRNGWRNGFVDMLRAGRFSMVFSMLVASTLRVSLSSLLFGGHHEKCGFTVVILAFPVLRHFARSQLRPNFGTKFALDSLLDFVAKLVRNRSKSPCECALRVKSASNSILGPFFASFWPLGGASGCIWVPLGDPGGSLGRPWGAQGAALGRLGAPLGVPGGSPRASWDQPGPPGATRGRSGRVFTSKTTKNGDSCRDSRCCIVNPHNCRHFCAKSEDSCTLLRSETSKVCNCRHFCATSDDSCTLERSETSKVCNCRHFSAKSDDSDTLSQGARGGKARLRDDE